jgi:hypothetical protein
MKLYAGAAHFAPPLDMIRLFVIVSCCHLMRRRIMNKDEMGISWNPVPRAANQYMALTVNHVEQLLAAEGLPVLIVVSSTIGHETGKVRDTVWRIRLHFVHAYRSRPMGPTADRRPLTWPPEDKAGRVACWEIVHSRWLPEAVGEHYSNPNAVHHFVIADYDHVYEIAAQWWEVVELGEWSEVAETLRVDMPR